MSIGKRHLETRPAALVVAVLVLFAASVWALDPPHNSTNNIDCSDCHAMHGSGMMGYVIARGAAQETQCKSCHKPGGQASTMANVANHEVDDGAGGTKIIDCGSCHDPHGPMESTDTHPASDVTDDNLSLIRSDPDKYVSTALTTAVFHDKSPSAQDYVFTTSPYNGICQTCHTSTDYYQNDGGGSTHETGDCTACHDTARGDRRAVVAEFNTTNYPSHHLQDTSLDADDCEVCHKQDDHKAGDVRLLRYESSPEVIVELTGDPNTTSSQATLLEPFCLDCHQNSANLTDTTPFLDGKVPADIASDWTSSSSHNSNSSPVVTCYGNGTFGCHASGHGSKKLNLLAPYATAPSSPAYAEEEEGFCFHCHDSGGPASYDVESDFPSTINTVGQASGVNDSTTLNDRHDVQYAASNSSGAVIECWDCHDPHAATSSAPLIADPDPGDSHDPDDSDTYYFSSSTKMTEWCLDCHDGSLPSGITAPTTALQNIKSTWANDDSHGTPGGKASLRSGYGWDSGSNPTGTAFLQCLDCHAPHNGARSDSNLYQLKDVVYSADGSSAVPSDGGSGYNTTDNDVKNAAVNGYDWCNTCHTNSMGGQKDNCFDCHFHGAKF